MIPNISEGRRGEQERAERDRLGRRSERRAACCSQGRGGGLSVCLDQVQILPLSLQRVDSGPELLASLSPPVIV